MKKLHVLHLSTNASVQMFGHYNVGMVEKLKVEIGHALNKEWFSGRSKMHWRRLVVVCLSQNNQI